LREPLPTLRVGPNQFLNQREGSDGRTTEDENEIGHEEGRRLLPHRGINKPTENVLAKSRTTHNNL